MYHNLPVNQMTSPWNGGSFAIYVLKGDRQADGAITGKGRVSGNYIKLTP